MITIGLALVLVASLVMRWIALSNEKRGLADRYLVLALVIVALKVWLAP
jgi:hypothetical protein